VERVYASETHARRILRERIFAVDPATLAERELVKVAAKRLQAPAERPLPSGANVVRLAETPPLPDFEIPETRVGAAVPRADVARTLERMKLRTSRAREKWSSDRPVAALLLDRDGRVLASAWNTNAVIRTRHAERNLCEILARDGRKIPTDATLYVSLKPCRMCAARIWETAEDPAKLNVVYFENDPGPLAQGTMLEARSAARVRYLGLEHPLFAAVVSRIAGP
jgi:tRNA(Arg) A34 adenosine deaminase TadA